MNPGILNTNTQPTPEELAAQELAAKGAEAATQDSEKETDDTVLTKDGKKPNIVHVGNHHPITKINNGMSTIKLPSAEDQADKQEIPAEFDADGKLVKEAQIIYKGKPFYHKKAGVIRQLFPDQYKEFTEKGK